MIKTPIVTINPFLFLIPIQFPWFIHLIANFFLLPVNILFKFFNHLTKVIQKLIIISFSHVLITHDSKHSEFFLLFIFIRFPAIVILINWFPANIGILLFMIILRIPDVLSCTHFILYSKKSLLIMMIVKY